MRDGASAGQPISAITLSGAGQVFTNPFDVGSWVELMAFTTVTANGGTTPTLDIRVQYSPDGKNFIDSGDAFTQITTTNSVTVKKLTANFGKYMRLGLVLGGTAPTYTLSVVIIGKN